jgi:DNA-binding response OmpR family regulator
LNSQYSHTSFIGLIDDDQHSAYLFTRMLTANDGPSVRHYGDGGEGMAALVQDLSEPDRAWPDVLVVDLKAHSNATLDFVRRHQALLRQKGVAVLVMVPPTDQAGRVKYLEVGAAGVFFRQPELDAYRRELATIKNFWARTPRLDAVGM